MFNEKLPSYLFDLIPNFNRVHNTRLSYNIPPIKVGHDSFFTSASSEWTQLNLNIRNSASLNTFKKKLLNLTRSCAISIFDIHNLLGIKLLARLRLGLSHLHEHKFKHCFQDTLNPLCECDKHIESTMHFFSHCTNLLIPRKPFFKKLGKLMIASYLKDNQNYHSSISRLIIISTIEHVVSTKRFKCLLLIKVFFVKKAGSKTSFSLGYYICVILFFLLLRYVN